MSALCQCSIAVKINQDHILTYIGTKEDMCLASRTIVNIFQGVFFRSAAKWFRELSV
jgi:hypothetical protein